jgi:hypothetical protein
MMFELVIALKKIMLKKFVRNKNLKIVLTEKF